MLKSEKVAVIDVGSNSCRLVIYERAGVAFLPYFNEKSMAGLGKNLSETGTLSVEGKATALETFRRFRAILEGLNVETCHAVATSAVREARDGKSFKRDAEAALGLPLRILSGVEEGHTSANGVVAGFRKPKGLVADLGGSSLELFSNGKSEGAPKGETFLLGPLACADDNTLSLDKRRKIIREILGNSKHLPLKVGRLFAVGGAWRNVAAVHMNLTAYPLMVNHAYRLDRKGLSHVIASVQQAQTDVDMKARLQRVSKRRYGTLLHAALVLDALLDEGGADAAHISAYGLRDGLIASSDASSDDRLLDATDLYFKLSKESANFGSRLYEFLTPILEGVDENASVLKAVCLMADAGARLHPEHRCQLVFEQVLHAPMPLLSHSERVFAAYAVASRYSFKFQVPAPLTELITPERLEIARMVGTAMRLGGVYSGRSGGILKTARLIRADKTLTLAVLKPHKDMISGTVRRRHQQLAGLMQLDAKLETVEHF